MSNESQKPSGKPEASKPMSKPQTAPNRPGLSKPAEAPMGPVPPLYRKVDWITFVITTLIVFAGYFYTLSPDLTLEDSGELAVGSFYAGVPHPPGYPVWTIYTWLFTQFVPFSNIAWRVSLSSAVAGAFSCGLLALLVARGSSMILEGIASFKDLDKKWEDGLCLVSGLVAGCLLGFNGFMWSQAVIVEVYTLSVLSLMLLLCAMLRWTYAPHQLRYLYLAAFWFGICFTNHQTLIVAAMGIEVAVLAAAPRLGRDLFLINTIIYLLGLWAKGKGILTSFDNNPPLFFIYNVVGVGSALVSLVMIFKTMGELVEMITEACELKFKKLWKTIVPPSVMGLMFVLGASFYFYMPIASMSNPPMNWGYPRTEEGFWHALTRGQYDKTSPTAEVGRLIEQIGTYIDGAKEEFNVVCLFVAVIPFLFFARMQKREKAWMIGLTAIYLCLAFLLLILLNPGIDRQAKEQTRVFFTASHLIIAIWVGYGLTLIGGLVATQYEAFRKQLLIGAAVAVGFSLYALMSLKTQFFIDRVNALFFLGLTVFLAVLFFMARTKIPRLLLLGAFACIPIWSVMGHWAENEQRGHLFGYYFGHDMFTPPFDVYPKMPKDSIIFGGTDPGRFCPTYMIFCEGFIPPEKRRDPEFDRRDCYLITQNALADGTYLSYIRAHYNRSTQIDPPFFVNFLRSQKEEEEGRTNFVARMSVPLDNYFTKLGADIEARRRKEGVYPMKEIKTPNPEDYQVAFQTYLADAQRRLQHDMQAPNEPKQIRPGEDVHLQDGKISVSGQVAVMAINGLLTKVIFDKNPDHEFYLEESFALDWMFPYLTPAGIIMKINRNQVPEMTEEMVKKDHQFWTKYAERFIGDWITYDTPVKEICDFAEKTYLRRDYKGFNGDTKFVRDDNAQKAFSKLRSAIGGVYFWRISNSKNMEENKRMVKEAEFAFRQSFAFCPYSPEAVFKYVNLLVNLGRASDAEMVAATAYKFDPDNQNIFNLLMQLRDIKKGQSASQMIQSQVSDLETLYRSAPTNLDVVFKLASAYLQTQRTNDALRVFKAVVDSPSADARALLSVAQAYTQLSNMSGLEATLAKLVKLMPDNPDAWFDLSRAQAVTRKSTEAIASLGKALELSKARLAAQPGAKDLHQAAETEPSFNGLRQLPEFQKVMGTP